MIQSAIVRSASTTSKIIGSIKLYRLSLVLLTLGIFLLFFSTLIGNFITLTTSPNDGPLIIWLINQSSNFFSMQGKLYHWPIFYPYPYTATYSDPFITMGILLIPIRMITQNPVTQHNIFIVLSIASSFISMYLLARTMWKNTLIAWVTATVFCFSYLYLQFVVHLHTLFIVGLPLTLWALLKYRETQQKKYVVAIGIVFLSQACNQYWTIKLCFAVALIYTVSDNIFWTLLKDRAIQYMLVLTLAAAAWFYIPYIITADTFNAARTIKDAAHFSFSVSRLLWPDISIPAIVLLWAVITSSKKLSSTIKNRTWIVILLLGLFFVLGPVVKTDAGSLKVFGQVLPLPYAVAYYITPGISAFRAVSRWSIVLNFGISLGVGSVLAQHKIKPLIIFGVLGIWLTCMLTLFQKNIQFFTISTEVFPIYETVHNRQEKAIAELPVTQWDMSPFDGLENQRLLSQLYHKKALYNGVSGIMPQQRSEEVHLLFETFPENQAIEIFKRNQIELLVVHFDEYEKMAEQNFIYGKKNALPVTDLRTKIAAQESLELVECSTVPDDCLYKIK